MLEVSADTKFKTVVVTDSLPWWSLMAAQMGAKILSSWNYAASDHLDFVREHFVNCPIYDGSVMGPEESATWKGHLAKAMVIFFDRHPRTTPFREVWAHQGPHMIVVSQGSELNRTRETREWHVWSTTLRHSEIGGVTNRKGVFTFYVRDQQRLELFKKGLEKGRANTLRQDLRCVLKAGIPGIPTRLSKEDLDHEYKTQVIWAQKPNVISSAGLLPWPLTPKLRVRTLLGGTRWVIRPIEMHEVLAAMDVPEHMCGQDIRGNGSQLSPEKMLALIPVPLKMLQVISEGIGTAYDINHMSNKRKLGEALVLFQDGQRMQKRVKSKVKNSDLTLKTREAKEEEDE